MNSFYWFDYETFGTSPMWDRPAQFAGLRTTISLEVVGDPLMIYCQVADDYLPHPAACRVTGLSPQEASQQGRPETEFINAVVEQIGAPGTCSVGYNSIRFDDEFTRHTLFRNLREPYAHEWRDGNSRWDLLDVVRLTRALRPEGIAWPDHDDGRPSNRLEQLTAINGLEHAHAHDALSDVYATLAVARLIRDRQPRLFEYALSHRDKASVSALLNWRQAEPVLQISGMLPWQNGHAGIVVPIAAHPVNSNGVIVLDLAHDPRELEGLDADAIAARVFAPSGATQSRLGIRTVHINKCPMIVPLKTLRPSDAERLGIDVQQQQEHTRVLRSLDLAALASRIADAHHREYDDELIDVDGSLYSGGFLSSGDRQALNRLLSLPVLELAAQSPVFDDPRLSTLWFRYRARNYPDTLNTDEQGMWRENVRERLFDTNAPWLDFSAFDAAMAETVWPEEQRTLAAELTRHRNRLTDWLS